MSTQLLFYTQATPLSATSHRDLCVKSGSDFSFARNASSVPLTVAEFALAASEYPIVFATSGGHVLPIAILGARRDENLYLRDDGTWRARYIPAFVRRYPFVFAQQPNTSRLLLCIDESFSGCNREGRGERLFDADGERTAYLEQVLQFQRAYQAQDQRTRLLCKQLVDLELLRPVQAQVSSSTAESRTLGGMMIIDRAKLKTLDQAKVHELLGSDTLELMFLQLHSLPNLRRIGEWMPQPEQPATAPTVTSAPGDPAFDLPALGETDDGTEPRH